jgi:hypothetical protein
MATAIIISRVLAKANPRPADLRASLTVNQACDFASRMPVNCQRALAGKKLR